MAEEKNNKELPEEIRKFSNRLNKIAGQVTGIRKLLEGDAYPTEILLQVSACHAALDSFTKEFISENLQNCALDAAKTNNKLIVDELARTLIRLIK